MFLHLSRDEKFIDSAHDAFERAAPGQHEFVVVDAHAPLRYIKSFEPARMRLEDVHDHAFLATLPTYDAVLLHSLNKANRLIVDAAPAGTRFAWLGWGFDYYHLICSPKSLWLPQTATLMARLHADAQQPLWARVRTALAAPARLRLNLRAQRIGSGTAGESELLRKIAFFAPVLSTEDALIRKRHEDFAPAFASWNYGVHDIVGPLAKRGTTHASRVVIGNSATPECNHLDAFSAVAGFEGEVVVPLSYGDPLYRDAILQAGRSNFGFRCRPLIDYMAADAYADLIAGSSHLVVNHLRQQGLTNILIALQAGTRVVMQQRNPLFPYLTALGLQIDDIADGLNTAPLAEGVVESNRQALEAVFGAANHHRRTCAFLAAIARTAHAKEIACTA